MNVLIRESSELHQVYICARLTPQILIFLATRGNTSDDEPGGWYSDIDSIYIPLS